MTSFFQELKQRRVVRVAIGYAIAAWLIVQIASTVLPTFHVPEWVLQALIVIVALGFPTALVLAWAFDVTPSGLEKTPEGTGVLAAKNRRHGWLLGGIGILVAVATVGAYWLSHSSNSTERHVDTPQPIAKGRSSSSAFVGNEKSIAVLPFKSLSEDKANNYFADGIQDEILTRLSKIADLKVISRTSTQKYQSSPENLREIAQQLGVTNILEGSVQKSGEQVRITVQLINATTDAHLWAETYDRKLTDIFGVETEVAQGIAASLEARLTGREQQQVAAIPTKNPQAYDAYLRGVALLTYPSLDEVKKARDFFRQAVELDPQYAQAWAQLAVAESQLFFSREHTPAQSDRARVAAETAVRLQPELGEARMGLGAFYYYCLQDFDRALRELDEAQTRSPGSADIVFTVALVKRRQGKLDEAIAAMRKAAVVDPRNSDVWTNLGVTYRGMRDFKSASEMLGRAHAISPDDGEITAAQAEMYLAQGDVAAAEGVLHGQTGTSVGLQRVAVRMYQRQFDDADRMLREVMEAEKNAPDFFYADLKGWRGELMVAGGDSAKGRPLIEQSRRELIAARNAGNTSLRIYDAIIANDADLGDVKEVEREATDMRQRTQRDKWRAPATEEAIAHAYATLGDADRAIPLIEHVLSDAYVRSLTPAILRLDPSWDKIRNDPRFQQLAGMAR